MSAILSPCGTYRYRLERDVQDAGMVAALFGVNPSTADATVNDATIRKDIGFAQRNGWRRIIKGNVFAYRSTDVRKLASAVDPVGPDNWAHLMQIIADADVLVPCWGSIGKVPPPLRREFGVVLTAIQRAGKPVLTFGLTKAGDPKHPLMLGYDTKLADLGNALHFCKWGYSA